MKFYKTIFCLLFFTKLLQSQDLSPYYGIMLSKRTKKFCWDHSNEDYTDKGYNIKKTPKGVLKANIYHFKNKRDSLLEKEVYYNINGKPIKELIYASVSKGELIRINKFFYNGARLTMQISYLGNSKNTVDTLTKIYTYDNQDREIYVSFENEFKRIDTIKTIYNENGLIEEERIGYGDLNWGYRYLHFYSNKKLDSTIGSFSNMFRFKYVFIYDTVNRISYTYAYLNDKREKILARKIQYNQDSSIASLFLSKRVFGRNWNGNYFFNLLLETKNVNEYLFECDYIINNRKVYTKKHYYFYK